MPRRFVYRYYTLCLIAAFLISLLSVQGAPGDLDSGFGTDGLTTKLDFDETYDEVGAVMEDAGGRIVMAGTSEDAIVLVRYLANGTLDTDFGTDGILITRGGLGDGDFQVTSVMQAPDGRYFVSGTYHFRYNVEGFDPQVFVMAFTDTGELDTDGFGSDSGVVILNPSGTREDKSIDAGIQIVGSEWYILVSYVTTNSDYIKSTFVSQLSPDGTESLYFGGIGTVVHDFSDYGKTNDLVIDSDGNFYLVGFDTGDGIRAITISKYFNYGYLDSDYGNSGTVFSGDFVAGDDHEGLAAALDADNSLLVLFETNGEMGVRKFSAAGELDSSFGSSGQSFVSFPFELDEGADAYLTPFNIQVRQDTGKIIVAATADIYPPQGEGSESYQPFFFQMTCDGSADPSFGTSGAQTYDVGSTYYGRMRDMVLDKNNRPVFGFSADDDLLAGRLVADSPNELFESFSNVYILHETLSGSVANNGGVSPPSQHVFEVGFHYATPGHITSVSVLIGDESTKALTLESSDETGETWTYSFSTTNVEGYSADYPTEGFYQLTIVFDDDTYTQLPAIFHIDLDTFAVDTPLETPFISTPYDGTTEVAVSSNLEWSPPYGGMGSANFVEYQLKDLDNLTTPVDGQLFDPDSRTTFQVPATMEPLASHLFYLLFARFELKRDLNSCILFRIGQGTSTESFFVTGDAPVTADDDTYAVYRNGTLTVDVPGVMSNDTQDGTGMVDVLTDVTHGTLALAEDGSFSYSPTPGYTGIDSFTYELTQDDETSSTATVTINVNNRAPVSVSDGPFTLVHDSTSTGDDANLLSNDTDADGDTLTASLVTDVANGTLTLQTDGSFSYTPDTGYTGSDSFVYKAYDGVDYSEEVTINLAITNADPTVSDDSYSILHDQVLTVTSPTVLANDSDTDGDTLTVTLDSDVSNGTLSLNSNGTFTYTPDTGYTGDDSFTYTATDGLATTEPATVTISVTNNAPSTTDDVYEILHDQVLSVDAEAGVLANDSDDDEDTITAALIADVANGTLSLNGNGSFSYTPDTGYVGDDTFTYKAGDGAGFSATTTVTISVTNTLPVATDDSHTVLHDTTLTVDAPGVLANDSDDDGDSLNVTLLTDVSNGTLSLSADGSYTYTPDTGFVGSDSFTYTLNDGVADAAVAGSVTIVVDNGAPVAVADSYSVAHGDTLTVTSPTILDNDTDRDGDTLTAVLDTDVSNGTLSLDPSGSFTYTPDASFAGTDSFTYVADDGATTSDAVTVTIDVTNTDPVADDDSYTIHHGDTLTVIDTDGVLANDTDADSDPLTVAVETDVANGSLSLGTDGSFVYTPDAGFVGDDTFVYTLSDDFGGSHTATVTITVTNTLPTTTADSYSLPHDSTLDNTGEGATSVLDNDSDVDEDTLTATLISTTTNGTLEFNSNGTFTYTPDAGFVGGDSFTYVANDGAESSTPAQEVTITVTNNVPTIADTSFTVYLNTPFTLDAPGLLADVTDDESDSLTAVLDGAPESGDSFELNADGSFTFDPGANFEGDYFTFHIEDGLGSSDFIVVTLTLGNLAPVAIDDAYTVAHNATLTVSLPSLGVVANDTDNEGDTLTATLETDVAHGTLDLNGDGTFTYTPEGDYVGDDSFTYYVTDNELDSELATVTITVTNGAPVGTDDAYNVSRNGVLNEAAPGVLANDSDPDGSTLEASLVTAPTNGTVTLNPDGSFIYHPNLHYTGTDSFVYQVSDSITEAATTNTATLTVTQKIFYVKPSTTGTVDGLSWNTAFNSLHDALDEALQGDEIWIAAGTYLTSDSNNRNDYFYIPYGVAIFGGFAGTESAIAQRNLRDNQTILSGEIGDSGSLEDNAYHVLLTEWVEFESEGLQVYNPNWPAFVLDGLMIEGGNALDDEGYDNGGGLIAWAPGGEVWNSTFRNNVGNYGGAVWDTAYGGTQFYNTQFHHNASLAMGGAIYNQSYENPAVINCSFAENVSGDGEPDNGGAIYSDTEDDYLVANSIVWGNGYMPLYGYFYVSYSDVEGISDSELGGIGNIDADPLFYDAASGDLRLPPTSPCIDAANSSIGTTADAIEQSRVDVPSIANSGSGAPAFGDMGALETNHRIWVSIGLNPGWNLVSYPYVTTSTVTELLGPEVLASYKWSNEIQDYVELTVPTPELGIYLYWDGASTTVNRPSPTFTEPSPVTRSLGFRWNIIGATTTAVVPTSAKSVIIYRFDSLIQDYVQIGTGSGTGETLEPGIGYWLFSSQATTSTF